MSFTQSLNAKYYDNRLSPEVLDILAPLDEEREEVHLFLDRMGRIMQRQGIGAHNFSELAAWFVAEFVPKLLPGAWNNSVPPITLQGRHVLLDRYLTENDWYGVQKGDTMLDLGCGFPPLTTIDTAETHPDLQILGADPSFGKYLLQDENSHYACFNANHELLYFQASSFDVSAWESVFADPDATRARFLAHLQGAIEELNAFGDGFGSIDKDGVNFQQNPVLQYARDNLSFTQQGIGSDFDRRFNVIRCMNVLIYFDQDFRQQTLDWAAQTLEEGGLVITGMDWAATRSARVMVNQCEGGELKPREMAISIDNVRPLDIAPWFSLQENDYETVAMTEITHLLRNDSSFVEDYDRRMDELFVEHGLCPRKENGYLGTLAPGSSPDTIDSVSAKIITGIVEDGFVDRAVESLNRQGVEARRNCIDFISVTPESLNL